MASLTPRTAGTESHPASPTPATASSRPWLRGYHPETIVESRPYDLVTIGSDPIAFLDALGEREAILVGHDWGAAIVYGAATLHPDRVRAIVPIAIPHPALLPRNPSTLWGARHFLALKMPWAEGAVRRADFAYLERLYRRWSPSWAGAARDRSLAASKRRLRRRALAQRSPRLLPRALVAAGPELARSPRRHEVSSSPARPTSTPRSMKRPPSLLGEAPNR